MCTLFLVLFFFESFHRQLVTCSNMEPKFVMGLPQLKSQLQQSPQKSIIMSSPQPQRLPLNQESICACWPPLKFKSTVGLFNFIMQIPTYKSQVQHDTHIQKSSTTWYPHTKVKYNMIPTYKSQVQRSPKHLCHCFIQP